MKILFICHRFPFPPNRGGKIRPFQMIRHLSKKHAVTVASLAHTEQELVEGSGLAEYCSEIIAEVLPNKRRWFQAATALARSYPSSAAYFWSPRLKQRIVEVAGRTRFDAVVVHCAFVAEYALEVKAGLRILDFGDLDSAKYFDYAHHRRFPLSVGYAYDARKLRRYERWLASQFDECTVTTAGEFEEFKTLGLDTPCHVIPNGVDSSYFRRQRNSPAAQRIIFLGRMDYYPNVEGICEFVDKCFPAIRRSIPNATLQIVGSNPTQRVLNLARIRGVSVTGYVPDVRPYLAEAAVAVAPLRIARGTQNKVLECMASGVPVVATPQAAKGIQARAGKHLLVADEVQEFAAHVVKILESPALQVQLADAARQQIEWAHNWSASLLCLDSILERTPPMQAELVLP